MVRNDDACGIGPLEDSELKAARAVDAYLASFQEDLHERIRSAIAIGLEDVKIEAEARLYASLDQALAAAKQRNRALEQELATAVAQTRKGSEQWAVVAADSVRQCYREMRDNLEKQAQDQIAELAKKINDLGTNIERLDESLTADLKQRTEEAAQVLQSRIEQASREIIERAEKRIMQDMQRRAVVFAEQA